MSYIIKATAPTGYQLKSLEAFGMGFIHNGNGSYSAAKEFDELDNAINFLLKRADLFVETQEELDKLYIQVTETHTLTLDAVTAYLNEQSEQ